MTAGLPGTGIGGLFYLLAALLLPLRFVWLCGHGQRDRRHAALMVKQLTMSTSMIAAVWLTGTLMGYWRPAPTLIAVAPVIITAATLTAVLLLVEIGRLLIRPPDGFALGRESTSTV